MQASKTHEVSHSVFLFSPSDAVCPCGHPRDIWGRGFILGGKDMTGLVYPEGVR